MSLASVLSQFLKRASSKTCQRTFSSTITAWGIKSRWRAPLYRELKSRHKELQRLGQEPVDVRSQYIEWNYESELFAFGNRLGEKFDDLLLRQALTDISYIERETKKQQALGVDVPGLQMNSNSELATAGKALLQNYSSKCLRTCYPLLPEESVQSLVTYLTSEAVLSDVGLGIGLKDIILKEEHPPSAATVAKAFEALVATVNLSSGLDQCQRFMRDFVIAQLANKDIHDIWKIDEPEKLLGDILKRSGRGEPEPRLVFQSGKLTLEAVYQVAMYSDKQFIGSGYGENMPIAVEQAASDALRRLFQTKPTSSVGLVLQDLGESIKITNKVNMSLDEWSIEKANNIVMC